MKQFFKFLFASCLGTIIAFAALSLLGIGIISTIASRAEEVKSIGANSVLHLKLNQVLPELTNNAEVDPFDLDNQKILGLHDIAYAIDQAAQDDRIQGIFIEVDMLPTGFAAAGVLREALDQFKAKSGKFIIAYSKYYTQGAYYVASVADEIYVHPVGLVDFRGFAAQVPFYKNLLDNVGVNMQVFYAGKYKSATEPYRRTDMSPESKEQIREFLKVRYDKLLNEISASRNISKTELHRIADNYLAGDVQQAKALGMVDYVSDREEALASIRKRLGLEEDAKIKSVTALDVYNNHPRRVDLNVKNKIAVVYAEGNIVDGKGSQGAVGDEKYVKIIDELSEDDRVKAVVLRVNSPGGSAMASESMWQALMRLKETGKPLVVSMGDYAASGGYYISCPADSIFAQTSTLTGSIGVFSIIPSFQRLLNDKLGITTDSVKTGHFAAGIDIVNDMDAREQRFMQNRTDQLYELFKSRVADGRNMDINRVQEIAQGRVWVGTDALQVGLVDRIGGLDDAIESAATLAGIEEYRLGMYPHFKEPLIEFIESLTGEESVRHKYIAKAKMGELYPYYEFLEEISKVKGVQARLPFFLPFE
jgi:protease-4